MIRAEQIYNNHVDWVTLISASIRYNATKQRFAIKESTLGRLNFRAVTASFHQSLATRTGATLAIWARFTAYREHYPS
ncbi:hypothetical protein AXW37_04590 [Yersinia ruckeri]|nr:hypothetical protein UGYR_05455 [Yersinia ruckeri]AUQ42375.1 hypothetical protein NJ56_10965 [Yersinia ruckeri]OIX34921.1 hypothetical protein AXW19_04590 [Yersinia ruckeri]OIX35205.1 hypothetical protein AXW20_04585 [Yersinia ruckeri]OIX35490.1 hypothetical protein AXW18_04590 [Yersinia ruckeri]